MKIASRAQGQMLPVTQLKLNHACILTRSTENQRWNYLPNLPGTHYCPFIPLSSRFKRRSHIEGESRSITSPGFFYLYNTLFFRLLSNGEGFPLAFANGLSKPKLPLGQLVVISVPQTGDRISNMIQSKKKKNNQIFQSE